MQSSNPVRLFHGVASEIYGQSGSILSLGYIPRRKAKRSLRKEISTTLGRLQSSLKHSPGRAGQKGRYPNVDDS